MRELQPSIAERSTEQLMKDYVNIANLAMEKHGDRFPLKQVLGVIDSVTRQDNRVGVAVYSTSPSRPQDYFTVRYNQAQRLELAAHGREAPDIEWKLNRSYLEEVARNRQRYIDHPLRLDWEWVKSRIRDSLPG